LNLIGPINLPNYPHCELWRGQYPVGGHPSVVVANFEGEIVLKVSVNLPDAPLEPRQFHVKTWAENESFLAPLLRSGYFRDTGSRLDTGDVQVQVWELAEEAIEQRPSLQ
jgi:hypothetical protein